MRLCLFGEKFRMILNFSSEAMEDRIKWQNTFQMLEEKKCQPRILCPVKISFRDEGEVKTFSAEGKPRNFSLADLS